ncbi:MAG TPA: hypothetical protein VKA55_11400 [Gammaproteobacteria bacterium]|nr:hypothetical protein [Gammaproteobacteria bacterium]
MLLLRAALALTGLGILAGLLMWVLSRDRLYLRWSLRIAQVLLVLVLARLGLMFGARLLALG